MTWVKSENKYKQIHWQIRLVQKIDLKKYSMLNVH